MGSGLGPQLRAQGHHTGAHSQGAREAFEEELGGEYTYPARHRPEDDRLIVIELLVALAAHHRHHSHQDHDY